MRETRFAKLSAFVAVADCGSFTKAAAQLGLSTGTLSHTIRELEESLGVRLLNRTTRSVAVTDAGERMLTRLRPLFDEFEAAVDSVNAFRDRPAGQLRITVPPPVASFVLAPLLARFMAQYPDIVLEVSADPVLTDIVVGRYDAGIRLGHRVARDMIAVRVTDDLRFVVVASPDYLARHPRPAKPQDLHAHNCIRLRFPSGAFVPWRVRHRGQDRRGRGRGLADRQRSWLTGSGRAERRGRALRAPRICGADDGDRAVDPVAGSLDTATVRGIFPVLPKHAAEPSLAACADRLSSHEPQSKNWVGGQEAADDLGKAADEGTDVKAEGLHDS
jgi:DNA-binding transcriptional LysR family regulator